MLFFQQTRTTVFFVGGEGGWWSCHNKGLSWLICTVFFSCENFKKCVWLFFTHTCSYFHVCVFKEIFTYIFLFSRTGFQKFSRKGKKNTHGKPKIVYNFHGRDFDFHAGKNAAHPSLPVIQGKNNKQHFLKISHIISLKVEKILDKLDLKKKYRSNLVLLSSTFLTF